MRIFGASWFWVPCLVAGSVVSIQAACPQPPSPARNISSKVGEVAVADILQRLGAKLEQGTDSRELVNYSNQFDRSDPNRDGKHTREEYVNNGGYMTPQARAGIFRAADGNADGVVTKAEYIVNRIITDEAKAIVQEMDDNENGLVERAEFVGHSTKLFSAANLAEQVFAALDTNADGTIPIPEYLRVWGQWARLGQKTAEERIAARRAQLANVAKNPGKNPTRTGTGRHRAGPPPGRPGAGAGPPSVDEVFERFDSNRDGKLQMNEVPQFARQFILPADADGDNMVTKEELQASRQRHRPGGEGRSNTGAPGRPNRGGKGQRDSDNHGTSGNERTDTVSLFGGQAATRPGQPGLGHRLRHTTYGSSFIG